MTAESRERQLLHVGSGDDLVREAADGLGTGTAVTTVDGVDAVLDLLADRTFDCLVCEDAPGAIEALTAFGEHGPAVFLAGAADRANAALEAGAADVLVRSDELDERAVLRGRLGRLLGPDGGSAEHGEGLPRRNRDRIESIARTFPDEVHVLDLDGRFTSVVPPAGAETTVSGHDPSELVGEHISTIVPESDLARAEQRVRDVLTSDDRRRTSFEVDVETNDSERVPQEVHIAMLTDEAGRPTGTVSVVRDISERKERERRLREEREFSDLLLDTLDDVFYLLDDEGDLVRWNDSFQEVTGYADAELAGMNALDFFEGEDRERIADAIAESMTEGTTRVEAEFVAKDGTAVPFEFMGARLERSDGGLRGIVGIGRDVSERKRREAQLERERDRRSALFENAADPMMEVRFDDRRAVIEQVNAAFETTFGIDGAGVSGSSVDEAIVPEDEATESERLDERVRNGEFIETEVRRRTTAGDREFVLRAIPIDRPDGNGGAYAWLTDVTQRKRRKRKLERTRERMELALEVTNAVVWSVDFESGDVTFYPSAKTLYGVDIGSREEFLSVVHPEDRERVADAIDRGTEDGSYATEFRITRDGDRRWIAVKGRIAFEDGVPVRAVGVARDVTERKERERELELKDRAMDEAPVGITIHDATAPANPVTYVNQGLEDLTGYDGTELTGDLLSALSGVETDESKLATLRSAMEREEPATTVVLLYRADGTPFWGRLSVAPVGGDEVTHFVGFLQDVTESKEHEQRIERRLDEFSDVLAEELRTPVERAREALAAVDGVTDEDPTLDDVDAWLERTEGLLDDLATVHSFTVKSREATETATAEVEDEE